MLTIINDIKIGVIKKLANTKSQEKRNRQNEKRRFKNFQVKSSIRTATKSILTAIENKDFKNAETLKKIFEEYTKTIDTAGSRGILHKNTIARKKSRLAKKVNSILQQQT